MLWTRSELKGRAKFLLKQNYWYSVLAALIYTFLLGNGFTYSYNVLKNKNSEVETSIQGLHPILMFGIAATVAVVVVISFIVYLAIAYFLWNPMTVGCCKFFKNGRDGRQDVKDIFRMVRDCNKTIRMTMFLKTIYLALWSLLFIVPGVIKGYGFVKDLKNAEKYFFHISGLIDNIIENNIVTFELEKGSRGMNAVKIKLKK